MSSFTAAFDGFEDSTQIRVASYDLNADVGVVAALLEPFAQHLQHRHAVIEDY